MLACVLHKPGSPSVLKATRVPIPIPRPGSNEVRIRVKAFGLNRAEMYTRQGLSGPTVPLPRILGIEAVGIVDDFATRDEHGAESTATATTPTTGDWKDGRGQPLHKGSVVATIMGGLGRTRDGSYAEYTVVPAPNIRVIPNSLVPSNVKESASSSSPNTSSHSQFWTTLASLPESYQTAWGSLVKVMQTGTTTTPDTLFIRGGTSTVGLAAAAIAKHHLKLPLVVATTRSEAKAKRLLEIGNVDDVILDSPASSISQQVLARYPAGFTRVLELVGYGTLKDSLKIAGPSMGTVCLTGYTGGKWNFEDTGEGFEMRADVPLGVKLTHFGSDPRWLMEMPLEEYVGLALKGEFGERAGLRVSVLDGSGGGEDEGPREDGDGSGKRRSGLHDIVRAHEMMEASEAEGKIVILV